MKCGLVIKEKSVVWSRYGFAVNNMEGRNRSKRGNGMRVWGCEHGFRG